MLYSGARFEARNPSMPMERFAILNRSMPCTSAMSNFALLQVRQSSAFQRFVKLSMRNAIYIFSEKYT
jgi:hypothetical protein